MWCNCPDVLVGSSSGSDVSSRYDSPEPSDLGVGSVVEVKVTDEPHYGVIRWIGSVPGDKPSRRVAGIEMVSLID